MLALDLKLLGFGVLLALVAAFAVATWLARRGGHSVAGTAPGVALPSDVPLLAVLEDAPFGLLVVQGACFDAANGYARRLLHLAAPEGDLPDTDWLPLLDADRQAARGAGGAAGRYRNVTFASGRTARWWVLPWDGRDFVFLLDITAQQRAEQTGRALVNDLAHELRTPIATVLTHLEILGLDDVGADVHRQSLELSRGEAQRMARLVNDMLELGRLETSVELDRRPVDVLVLVEDVVLHHTPRAIERGIDLALEAESPLPLVPANADRLRQVFANLIDNAIKYGGSGDRVTVSLRREAEGLACAVCDTGPGIPPEHLPHLTRRFYRAAAPPSVEGSGLGLALVSEILRRHASALAMESPVTESGGTCARFVLSGGA